MRPSPRIIVLPLDLTKLFCLFLGFALGCLWGIGISSDVNRWIRGPQEPLQRLAEWLESVVGKVLH